MNKAIGAVCILLTLLVGYQFYLNHNLTQRVAALENATKEEEVTITPVETKEPSPFDEPVKDPAAAIMENKMPDLPPDSKPAAPKTNIKYDKTTHDFGRIAQGEKVRTTFKFANTGPNPLIITNAVGSCGCTVPKWPKEPIAPGKKGEIEVEFDSAHKSGEQNKSITVTANTSPTSYILNVKSVVVPAKD